jgi:hypothetical protein
MMKNFVPFPRTASPDKLPRLELSELLFLCGFRVMARHRGCDCAIVAATKQLYRQCQVEDSLGSLDALVETFAATMRVAIEIHAPNCPCVSESEMFLLGVIAAAQSADLDLARRGFERWLPGLAADWALGPACEIARIFQAAGLMLPSRDVDAIGARGTAAPRNWTPGSTTLH